MAPTDGDVAVQCAVCLERPGRRVKLLDTNQVLDLCSHCTYRCRRCGCSQAKMCRKHEEAGQTDMSQLPSKAMAERCADLPASSDGMQRVRRCGFCRSGRSAEYKVILSPPPPPSPTPRTHTHTQLRCDAPVTQGRRSHPPLACTATGRRVPRLAALRALPRSVAAG